MNRRRLIAGGAAGVVAIAVWVLTREPIAAALADGVIAPGFGTRVRLFGADPQELVDRAFWLTWVLCGIAVVLLARYPHRIRQLFLAPGYAVDLAVTRIVVFGVLAVLPRVGEAVALSSVSPDLRRPPAGVPWLLDVIPPSRGLVLVLAIAFVVACVASAVGLFTRVATITAVVLGFYVLGLPQFYGKVSHYHHLLWIAAVLAAAPSGAALSVDAMRRAWRSSQVEARQRSVAYGFPLRVIWLLIAITYLFPGMWKFVSAGFEWALSDNLRTVMYEHWTRLDGFVPILPVDQWPVTYQLGGLFTLAFELFFVFVIWTPRTRIVGAVIGLIFHNINLLFLRLGFVTLQLCYVAFVPWQRLADRLGARLGRVEVHAADGTARRLLAAVSALDPSGRMDLQPAQAGVTTRVNDREAAGWPAVALAVRAVPLAWPLLPLLALVPAGRRERWIAGSEPPASAPRRTAPAYRAVAVVGAVLVLGNSYAGVAAAAAAWPFACYPTFAGQAVVSPEILFVVHPPDGPSIELSAPQLREAFTWEKLDGLTRPILNNRADAERRARALLETAEQSGVDVPPAGEVEVYRSTPEWTPRGVRSTDRELVLRFTR